MLRPSPNHGILQLLNDGDDPCAITLLYLALCVFRVIYIRSRHRITIMPIFTHNAGFVLLIDSPRAQGQVYSTNQDSDTHQVTPCVL